LNGAGTAIMAGFNQMKALFDFDRIVLMKIDFENTTDDP
jgi:hypothetical protein